MWRAILAHLRASPSPATPMRYEPTTWPCCGAPRHPAMHHMCPMMAEWEKFVAFVTKPKREPPITADRREVVEALQRVMQADTWLSLGQVEMVVVITRAIALLSTPEPLAEPSDNRVETDSVGGERQNERDARRYRWLRARYEYIRTREGFVEALTADWDDATDAALLDAHIDAAIASEGKPQEPGTVATHE
jgi:hypothetical protein